MSAAPQDAPETPGDDGYAGAAQLLHPAAPHGTLAIEVTLRGQVDTIAGSYHWYGRVAADPAVAALAATVGSRGTVTLRTPVGEAPTSLADPDTWGRYRVQGRGHAPFEVLSDVPDTAADTAADTPADTAGR